MVPADGTGVVAAKSESRETAPAPRGRRAVARPKPPARAKIDRRVIEFQPDSVEIEERPIPGGARWTLYVIVALIVAAVAWAWVTKVDRIVETQGRLVTTVEPIVIQPLQSSVIREIRVRFGDRVRPGQTLAILDGTFSEAEVAKLKDGIAAKRAALARLEAERNGTEYEIPATGADHYQVEQLHLFVSRRREQTSKRAEIQAELRQAEAEAATNRVQLASVSSKIELLERLTAKAQELFDRGSQSEVELLNARLKLLEEQTIRDNLQARIREFDEGIALSREKLATLDASFLSEVDEQRVVAQQEVGQLQEELAKALRLEELVELVVPEHLPDQEYVVFEIAERTTGSVAQEDQPLIKLIPVDVPLEVEIEIAAKDIGYLQLQDPAKIKLEAFTYQKHGYLEGKLRTISEGSFTEKRAETPITFFRGRVSIDPDSRLDGVPEDALMPGMATGCEIRVGERRVLEYVLYPLIRQLDRSVREP